MPVTANSPSYLESVCLAQNEDRYPQLVPNMSPLPILQSTATCPCTSITMYLPDRRFGSLHVDIVGPLPESESMTYLFTIVDQYTRWAEVLHPWQDAVLRHASRVSCYTGEFALAFLVISRWTDATVHLGIMDRTKQDSGNFGQQHHCLPTPGK